MNKKSIARKIGLHLAEKMIKESISKSLSSVTGNKVHITLKKCKNGK